MNWPEFFKSVAPAWIQALAAIAAVVVACWQLPPLIRSLRVAALSALLQFEAELNARRVRLLEQAVELHKLRHAKKPDEKLIELNENCLEATLENYLNAVDRLAQCILRNELGDRDWKTDYRQHIIDDVEHYSHKFGPNTPYRNIRTLYETWK